MWPNSAGSLDRKECLVGLSGKLESASQNRERIGNFKKVSAAYPLNLDVYEI